MTRTFKAIHELWFSPNPLRREHYDQNTIWLNVNNGDMGLDEDFNEFGIYEIMDQFSDETGLVRVVAEVHYTYSKDYWGEWDLDVEITNVMSMSKCKNFSELIRTWCMLNGKERFSKKEDMIRLESSNETIT